jgi:hypothetical protein
MEFFNKPNPEKMEEKKEMLHMETEVKSQELELRQKEAAIKELERNYGSGWKKILGVNGPLSLENLRGLLKGANSGLKGMSGSAGSSSTSAFPKMPSVLPPSGMKRM